jgi:hypothetical protein
MGSIPSGRLTVPGPCRRSLKRPLLDWITDPKGREHALPLTGEADAEKKRSVLTFHFEY